MHQIKVHHVLYEWSELVEIDKHVEQLETAITSVNQLVKSLHKTDNQHLYNYSLISLRNELQSQLDQILSQFPNYDELRDKN